MLNQQTVWMEVSVSLVNPPAEDVWKFAGPTSRAQFVHRKTHLNTLVLVKPQSLARCLGTSHEVRGVVRCINYE